MPFCEGLEGGSFCLGESELPLAKLLLESVLFHLLEDVHIGLDVGTEDEVSVFLSVVSFSGLAVLKKALPLLPETTFFLPRW